MVSFSCRLVRIEVHSAPHPDEDEESALSWTIFRTDEADIGGGLGLVVVSAHLHNVAETWWAQSMVVGQLVRNRSNVPRDQVSVDDLVSDFVEEMYDVGRREIEALARKMDARDVNLPMYAPATTIETYVEADD